MYICNIDAMLQFRLLQFATLIYVKCHKAKRKVNRFYGRAIAKNKVTHDGVNFKQALVFPTSLAVTKGILVSFFCFAALTDMFKFSAYTRLS